MTNVFVVSANGHCFYCLIKLEVVETDNSGGSSSVHPVQELCHYLEVDLRELASESGHDEHLPAAAVPEGTDPRLEVALCEDCASANEDFTDLYQRLKDPLQEEGEAGEIELEIAYCSKLLQRKFMATEKIDAAESNELRFAMALRKEIAQKCSQKLNMILSNLNDDGAPSDTEADDDDDPDPAETPQIEDIIKAEPPDPDNHQDEAMEELPEEPGDDDNIFTGFNSEAKKHLRIINPSKSLPTDNIDAGKPKWDPSGRLYKCQLCPKQFRGRTAAQRHYQSVHLGILYECTLCSKQFQFQFKHLIHFRSVHRGVRFKCRICSRKFSAAKYVGQHYQAVHSGQRFQCQFCSETFSSRQGRTCHVTKGHCRGKFGMRGTWGKAEPVTFDLKTETEEVKIEPGPSKSKSTPRKPNKANLAASEEAVKNYPFLEIVTEEDSTNNEEVEEPELEPQAIFNPITGKYKCHLCTKEYITKRNVRGHHKAVHLKLRYKCKLCGRIFINKQTCITHHSEVHVGTKVRVMNWKCLGCGKLFKQHSSVGRHQAKTGCGEGKLKVKTKKLQTSLKKSYACEVCGWMFVQPHDLERHAEELHSQKRNSKFECNTCGVEFTTRGSRTRHMLRLHSKKMK